jgi:hypothetical protein
MVLLMLKLLVLVVGIAAADAAGVFAQRKG